MQSTQIKENVRKYYKASTEDYLKYYQSDWHQHMHYGFDRDLAKGGNPTENLVRYMSEVADIKPGDKVLDAGCGVGGSSIWLAQNKGTDSIGLNLMDMQAHLAKGFAHKKGVSNSTQFITGDFTRLPFAPESFDIVWAVESSDHAPDKEEWIKSMYQLLKPGGRLIVADGFRTKNEFKTIKQEDQYKKFLSGWAVPHLAEGGDFRNYYQNAGFKNVSREDISNDVLPHAKAIFRFGLIFIPLRWILHKLNLTSFEKLGNAEATYYQYTTFKEKLWTYEIFCGVK